MLAPRFAGRRWETLREVSQLARARGEPVRLAVYELPGKGSGLVRTQRARVAQRLGPGLVVGYEPGAPATENGLRLLVDDRAITAGEVDGVFFAQQSVGVCGGCLPAPIGLMPGQTFTVERRRYGGGSQATGALMVAHVSEAFARYALDECGEAHMIPGEHAAGSSELVHTVPGGEAWWVETLQFYSAGAPAPVSLVLEVGDLMVTPGLFAGALPGGRYARGLQSASSLLAGVRVGHMLRAGGSVRIATTTAAAAFSSLLAVRRFYVDS